jgi:hypothetical protein
MMTVLTVLCVVCALMLLINIALLVSFRKIESDISLTRSDVIAIRRQSIPPNVGARSAPTVAELEAARNRIDPSGTAHPGGPG